MGNQIKGQKVLITGGARGIGYCTAHEFAKAGAVLILSDIDEGALDEAATKLRRLGAKVHAYAYDVSDQEQVKSILSKIAREVGDIDVLINNAGIGHTGELADTTIAKWKKLVDVNLYGPLYHVYALLPRMKARRAGQIVNVSSGQAFFKLPTWGAYAAIKAALAVFSEVLHFEVKKYGIHVTTVYPFMVDTPFYHKIEGDTWGTKLSMKLVPYYSMKPEKVGKIIFKSVKKQTRIEMVSVLNDVGFYLQFVPLAPTVIGRATDLFLAKSAKG